MKAVREGEKGGGSVLKEEVVGGGSRGRGADDTREVGGKCHK